MLEKKRPVVIPVGQHRPLLVATDGYHHTSPFVLKTLKKHTYYFKVGCVIEDDQLVVGLAVQVILYFMGLTADNIVMQALSFGPILFFLFLYYIKRKQFLRFQPA
ncbi:MAG: hypothetical protein EOO08_14200 [Chitinophagaceae bacterium]|nr:MAG: hypothetical protein EOO08_14200 [Chitinophagaceae bacterium]